jgi:protein involved in polysaccharide export with SLBB domain
VFITGEVRYPGAYSINSKQERISNLLTRAGGLMPNAFVKGARMQRANQQADQNIKTLQNTMTDSLLVKAEKQIASDQLELRLDNILKNPGSSFDYLLKDGDRITIPEMAQEVRISGEIQNPIGQAYESGKKLKFYVNRSGGFTDKAMKRRIFVIYSDGTTQVTHNFLGHKYPSIEPGSQIIIPKKAEKSKTDNSGKWLAIASTLSSIMLVVFTITKL